MITKIILNVNGIESTFDKTSKGNKALEAHLKNLKDQYLADPFFEFWADIKKAEEKREFYKYQYGGNSWDNHKKYEKKVKYLNKLRDLFLAANPDLKKPIPLTIKITHK